MTGITIVEVGPRDGFQSVGPVIPTARKLAFIDALHTAGLRRMEASAFVSPAALPQMADAEAIVRHIETLPGLDAQFLVPNRRHGARALDAGVRHLAFVLSVSEAHNRGNVRRSPLESAAEYAELAGLMPPATRMRLNIATAFDCPHQGAIAPKQTLALLERLVPVLPEAEICLCDTTGRVTPDRVAALFQMARRQFPASRNWAYHGHDTYGLGVANTLAAIGAGVAVVDSAFAGMGGCPFAPGATGNVATEDLVWTLEQMGTSTGVDLGRLLAAAQDATRLPGAQLGGRVRTALAAGGGPCLS